MSCEICKSSAPGIPFIGCGRPGFQRSPPPPEHTFHVTCLGAYRSWMVDKEDGEDACPLCPTWIGDSVSERCVEIVRNSTKKGRLKSPKSPKTRRKQRKQKKSRKSRKKKRNRKRKSRRKKRKSKKQ